MATIGPFSIRFDQRKSDNTMFKERYVSGSNLFLITDSTGLLTGSNRNLPTASFSEISASNSNFGATIVSGLTKLFDIVYAYAGIVGNVTGSVSGSRVIANTITASSISASSIVAQGPLNSVQYNLNGYLTGSSIFYITSSQAELTGNFYVTQMIDATTGSFDKIYLNTTASAPASSSSSGTPGEFRLDNHFMYIYTQGGWKRFAASKWS
jgi:hypothetical protein